MAHNFREITYVCLNPRCRAELVWRDFDHMAMPPVLNCSTCGAGFGMSMKDQMEQKKGMFPVRPIPNIHEAPAKGSKPS